MIRKIMLVAVVATAFISTMERASAQQRRQVMLDKVVAVVGGSAILHSEVEEYCVALKDQRRQMGYTSDRDPMSESLEALLEQKLLYNQALLDSVEVNTSDIAARIETYVQSLVTEAGGIAELEAKEHMPIYTYRELLRQRYEEQAYAQAMRQDVVGRVTVVPGEVERFYKRVDKDSLPMIGEQYVYAHITKFPSSLRDAQQRTKERLLDMRERVITGQTKFSVLARMYSMDGSAMYGGEMEPGPSSFYVRPFAEALEKLKPGQISEIVETEFGFHIIELIDKQGEMYHCRHILLRPKVSQKDLEDAVVRLDSLRKEIISDKFTFEDAARYVSQDKDTRYNKCFMVNVVKGSTRFEMQDLPQEVSRKIETMKIGDISEPFVMIDQARNKEVVAIVKLSNRIEGHRATLSEDYNLIKEMYENYQKENIIREWIEKKIKDTYVRIEDGWNDCEFKYSGWVK